MSVDSGIRRETGLVSSGESVRRGLGIACRPRPIGVVGHRPKGSSGCSGLSCIFHVVSVTLVQCLLSLKNLGILLVSMTHNMMLRGVVGHIHVTKVS